MDPDRRTMSVSVALPRADAEALKAAAEKRGVSFSSLVAGVLQAWFRRHGR
jgi:hypothetical protein